MAFIGIEIQDVALVKVSQYCILESGGKKTQVVQYYHIYYISGVHEIDHKQRRKKT